MNLYLQGQYLEKKHWW